MKTLHQKHLITAFFIPIIIGTLNSSVLAQNVAINGTGNQADPSAMLDVASTTAGVLIPRMTTAQRSAISSPAIGLQIYNTDCGELNYWNGTCWLSLGTPLPIPDSISSNSSTALCGGATATYTIPKITGATSYHWTVPPGTTINSGQGTTSISVTYGNYSGNVCVVAYDQCESSPAPSCLSINVTSPGAPGAITGVTATCSGASGVNYSIPVVSGATSYTWSVPSGASIISGQGTNAITVNFGTSSGNISVYATNSCGNSSSQTLSVTVTGSAPATPGTISGTNSACFGAGTSYSIAAVSGATSYTWSVPAAASILSGQGTTSVTVIFGASPGNILVYASNGCGNSATNGMGITVTSPNSLFTYSPALPSAGSQLSFTPNDLTNQVYSWIFPGPAYYSATYPPVYVQDTIGITRNIILTVTKNGCNSTTTVPITTPAHGNALYTATGSGPTGSLQSFIVPPSGVTSITIATYGAQGGNSSPYIGGKGAEMAASFTVTPGETLTILVGQQGEGDGNAGGGGGGTFVVNGSAPLIVAGGGSGADNSWGGTGYKNGAPGLTGTSGGNGCSSTGGSGGNGGGATNGSCGGAGFSTNGTASSCTSNIAMSFLNGGAGGLGCNTTATESGGYGGGSAADACCQGASGAGGGYSGGGGSTNCSNGIAGAGGSFIASGATTITTASGIQTGNGQVIITY